MAIQRFNKGIHGFLPSQLLDFIYLIQDIYSDNYANLFYSLTYLFSGSLSIS